MSRRVDVIVPTFNGREHLAICLPALQCQVYHDFRVIVVDDASTDGTADFVREIMPEALVLELPANVGFAAAVNRGVAAGDSEFVALLNNDTEADESWLVALVAAAERHPQAGAIASKLKLFDRRDHLHSAGDTFSRRGVAGNRGVWEEDRGQYAREEEVFGACAGAALYRRQALNDVSAIDGAVLDPDFFMYCEDVDLNWRLRLRGYQIVYTPEAIVYHRLSATGGGPLASYYVARNSIGVLVKDLPGPLLRRHLIGIVTWRVQDILKTLHHLREPSARARLRGHLAGLALARRLRRKRRRIQMARRASLEELDHWLSQQ